MPEGLPNTFSKTRQYIIGIAAVVFVACICYLLSFYMGYRVVALILLFTVSVTAMFFELLPVLTVAVLSALIWDYFFIPPKFTLVIDNAEDSLMLVMYFTVVMINAVLTFKSRQWEKIARQREEKRNTLKLYNNILNSLSHELRTPIAAIIGATDALKMHKAKLSGTDKDSLTEEISKASLKLNGHVENLLNMSRLESGVIKPKMDWSDVAELLYTVKTKLGEYSKHHSIEIITEDHLPLFYIDAGLIYQALYNLAYNAVIYTPANSKVLLKAAYANKQLLLTVEDNGKGFKEEELEQVFHKFFRPDETKTGGIGLGLSISKGFVEAHNGTIRLENKKTGGALFQIALPVEVSGTNTLKNE